FIIGSELRGLTGVRDGSDFPFVDALVALAADVKALIPGAKLTYAADWSEYSGVQSGGEKLFHLDPLWASPDIAAVGIDNYMPIADWRDGSDEADGPHEFAYLDANIEGGEGFDWYYQSDADRLDGIRTPITDGLGEPWIWRFKDIASWWSNTHHNRPGGVRDATPTAWVPGSKPIWFTELGCGAVDKGANQPNVFGDPKSSEDARPWFSNGAPDPLMQRQVLRAQLAHWAGSEMVERTYLWTWDARPFPAFPEQVEAWSDGPNHATGHWLTGRAGALASDEVARAVAADYGVELGEVTARPPLVHGLVLEGPASLREALGPVLSATGLSFRDTPEGLALGATRGRDAVEINEVVDGEPRVSRKRPDPGEAIGQVALSYPDRERSYLTGTVTAMRLDGGAAAGQSSPLVLDIGGARHAAERMLLDGTVQRDSIELTLPPSQAALEVGDAIAVAGQGAGPFEITEIRDGLGRKVVARAIPPALTAAIVADRPPAGGSGAPVQAIPVLAAAHLPMEPGGSASRLLLAAAAKPWPGDVGITEAVTGAAVARLARNAAMGELLAPLGPGTIYAWDMANEVHLKLYSGHLASLDDEVVLAGGNRVAIQVDDGAWEMIGFAEAMLVAPGEYRLRKLLRGQGGTDWAIGTAVAGNRVIVLDERPLALPVPGGWLGGDVSLRAYAGRSDEVGQAFVADIGLGPVLPLAPSHLRAERPAGSTDVVFTWLRRSRADTDNWALADAPLEAVPEGYRVTILDGAMPVRTLDSPLAPAIYTAAEQTADFGSLPAAFAFTVAQLSPVWGPGHAATGGFAG
ncbi:MAG TPA: glycoside hydrolase/phage tail family protein, partial [Devosia sp.]